MYTRPIRVLLIGQGPDRIGGIASVIKVIIENMPTSQFQFDVLNIETKLKGMDSLIRFLQKLVKQRPDIVHLHVATKGSVYRKLLIARVCLCFRIPVISHLHGHNLDVFVQSKRRNAFAFRLLLESSEQVITLGKYWTDFVAGQLPSASSKISAIRNAVPENTGTTDRRQEFLFVGAVGERKGTYKLVEAFSLVTENHWLLRIIGPGDLVALRAYAASLGITNRVQIDGPQDHGVVLSTLSSTGILVLPSTGEGLPMAILEALASSVPVIASDVGSIHEAVVEGRTGFLLKENWSTGDLAQLLDYCAHLDNSSQVDSMRTQCYAHWKTTFSVASFVEKMSIVYLEVNKSSLHAQV